MKSRVSLTFLNLGQGYVGCLVLLLISCRAIVVIAATIAMLIVSKKVSDGELTIGDVVAVNAYLAQLFAPLNWLGTSMLTESVYETYFSI